MAPSCQTMRGRACPLCPGYSDVDLFRYGKCVIDFDAEVPDRAFDLGVAQQQLYGSQVSGAAVDKGRLGSSERVGTEETRVQPDAGDPVGDEPSVLPCCEAPAWTTSASEQVFPWFLSGGPDVIVDRLAGLLRQLEPDGLPSLLLSHGGPSDRISARCDVLDLERDD